MSRTFDLATRTKMSDELNSDIEACLLACFGAGAQVVEARTYRPDYLPYPMRVVLRMPSGAELRCVVKIGAEEAIAFECRALQLLSPYALPVPVVQAGPIALLGDGQSMLVLSELPGKALPWCGLDSLAEADLACRLTIEAVDRLHALTPELLASDAARFLPRRTLADEYARLQAYAGPWSEVALFREALAAVGPLPAADETPLVFSNGDYNPLNFLHDGGKLCGFVDFEHACFEHPHIGFARFLIWTYDAYGWGTGGKAGLVERYLYRRNVSRREFAPVLALRGLSHLVREASTSGPEDSRGRKHLLGIIADALRWRS